MKINWSKVRTTAILLLAFLVAGFVGLHQVLPAAWVTDVTTFLVAVETLLQGGKVVTQL